MMRRNWTNGGCSAKNTRLMADLIAAFIYFLIKCNLNGNTLLRVAGWEAEDIGKLCLDTKRKKSGVVAVWGGGLGNKMKGSCKNLDSLWTHHPWRYSKLNRTRPRGIWHSWTHVEWRAELDQLQKSYQTKTVYWFCSSWAHSNERVELTSLPVLKDCPGQTIKHVNMRVVAMYRLYRYVYFIALNSHQNVLCNKLMLLSPRGLYYSFYRAMIGNKMLPDTANKPWEQARDIWQALCHLYQ